MPAIAVDMETDLCQTRLVAPLTLLKSCHRPLTADLWQQSWRAQVAYSAAITRRSSSPSPESKLGLAAMFLEHSGDRVVIGS